MNLFGTILSKSIWLYLNGYSDHNTLWQQKYIYHDLMGSKCNQLYKNRLNRIISYWNLTFQKTSAISYEWSIMVFVTDCTTVWMRHYTLKDMGLIMYFTYLRLTQMKYLSFFWLMLLVLFHNIHKKKDTDGLTSTSG